MPAVHSYRCDRTSSAFRRSNQPRAFNRPVRGFVGECRQPVRLPSKDVAEDRERQRGGGRHEDVPDRDRRPGRGVRHAATLNRPAVRHAQASRRAAQRVLRSTRALPQMRSRTVVASETSRCRTNRRKGAYSSVNPPVDPRVVTCRSAVGGRGPRYGIFRTLGTAAANKQRRNRVGGETEGRTVVTYVVLVAVAGSLR